MGTYIIGNNASRAFDPFHALDFDSPANSFYISRGELGIGLFASRRIDPNEVILRFAGPQIGFQEAVAKGERQCYPLQIAAGSYIDLVSPGCFANHSCEPNAGISDLNLISLVNIDRGQEIRYDYSTTMDEDFWEMECLCQTPTCRGRVTDFKHLPSHTRERYLERNIVMPFIAGQYKQRGSDEASSSDPRAQ